MVLRWFNPISGAQNGADSEEEGQCLEAVRKWCLDAEIIQVVVTVAHRSLPQCNSIIRLTRDMRASHSNSTGCGRGSLHNGRASNPSLFHCVGAVTKNSHLYSSLLQSMRHSSKRQSPEDSFGDVHDKVGKCPRWVMVVTTPHGQFSM
jgi:hypothetical protein